MSSVGGGSGNNNRVSIPSNVRKTIQNIKEITGSHSEEDIYAMLKECSMDPNETAQKLLLQDTFHDVRRKRDKKKENQSKDPTESRWKPGMQSRGNNGERGNHSSRNMLYDATAGGRNSASSKENGPNQDSEKGSNISSPIALEGKSKESNSVASLLTAKANGPTALVLGNMNIINAPTAPGAWDQYRQRMPDSVNSSTSMTLGKSSGVYFSSSDPGLSSSQDFPFSDEGTTKSELGIQQTVVEISDNSDKSKPTSGAYEGGSSNVQGKMSSKRHGFGKNQKLDSSKPTSSIHTISPASRPPSSYSNRSQVIGPQKVGPIKEWKPKSTIPNLTQGSGPATSSDALELSVEADIKLPPAINTLGSKEDNVELQKKFEELHISVGQHVIIPNHLHVPEIEKLGFCFGSFDARFGVGTSHNSSTENEQTGTVSETSGGDDEAVEEKFSSNQNAFGTVEEVDFPGSNRSASYGPNNLSTSDGGVSSSIIPEYNDSKQETASEVPEYSGSNTSSSYSYGFMAPILGGQLPPFASSESQARDASRFPTILVQQPFDPASYYAQIYRSGADSDGCISPFHSAGVGTKHSGNLTMVSPQTSQSQEVPVVLSTAAPTPLVSQTSGIMQSSMGVTQPLSVFRPSAGLHLPHYPSNYMPYGPYISPFYITPPGIHPFLGSGAFPQQPQGGSVYQTPPVAAAKYSLLQYKPGTNSNNSSHVGLPGSYVTYSSPMTTYNFSSEASAGNSTSNEDLASSHFKENNAYSGQQSEGSGVWINPPGHDISSIQASSFYNLPQGQVAFAPAQPGHGTFAGVYHPSQPVNATVHPLVQHSQTLASAGDMVGPAASVYQQSQHSQINWPRSF